MLHVMLVVPVPRNAAQPSFHLGTALLQLQVWELCRAGVQRAV